MSTGTTACPHASSCALFAKFRLKSALQIWQRRYCEDEDRYPSCQRYQLADEGKPVPDTLLPNGDSIPV